MTTEGAPKLSIIIPCYNDGEALARLLKQLSEYELKNSEIIVINSGQETLSELQASYSHIQFFYSKAGRAKQMNKGAKLANGAFLIFLHADTILSDNFQYSLTDIVKTTTPSWGFFQLNLSNQHWPYRMITWCINKRSKLTSIGTGDQCLWISKELLGSDSPFPELPLMEDVAFCKKLRRLTKPTIQNSPVTASSRRWEENGIFKTILLMWLLRFSFFIGIPTKYLAKLYYPNNESDTAHLC